MAGRLVNDVEPAHFRFQLHGNISQLRRRRTPPVVFLIAATLRIERREVDTAFGKNLKVAYLARVFVVSLPWKFPEGYRQRNDWKITSGSMTAIVLQFTKNRSRCSKRSIDYFPCYNS